MGTLVAPLGEGCSPLRMSMVDGTSVEFERVEEAE